MGILQDMGPLSFVSHLRVSVLIWEFYLTCSLFAPGKEERRECFDFLPFKQRRAELKEIHLSGEQELLHLMLGPVEVFSGLGGVEGCRFYLVRLQQKKYKRKPLRRLEHKSRKYTRDEA